VCELKALRKRAQRAKDKSIACVSKFSQTSRKIKMGQSVSVKGPNSGAMSYNDKLWMSKTDECRSAHPRPCDLKRLDDDVFCERHEGQKGILFCS
jgi:hypothetical protein